MEHARTGRTGNPPAWLLGPLAAGAGWAAHVAGGGQSPAVPILLALAALLGMAATMLCRRRLPPWAVLAAAALAQQILHLAFSALSASDGFALPGHGHGDAPGKGEPAPDAPGQAGARTGHDLHLMLYLHAAAALLTAWVPAQWRKLRRRNGFAGRDGGRDQDCRTAPGRQ